METHLLNKSLNGFDW